MMNKYQFFAPAPHLRGGLGWGKNRRNRSGSVRPHPIRWYSFSPFFCRSAGLTIEITVNLAIGIFFEKDRTHPLLFTI
jgi:hypothetical protein